MIKALLVDDEKNGVEVLHTLLSRHCPDIYVQGTAASVAEAYEKVCVLQPDIVFLDIQMPVQNGFELLKLFGEYVPFKVVFVTSHDKYAINAIKFSALDYLLKPVEVIDLVAAVNKAISAVLGNEKNNNLVLRLIDNLGSLQVDRTIAFHDKDKVGFVRNKDIEYISSEGRYSKLFLSNGKNYMVAKNLKEFEDYFEEEGPFLRINKGIILNLNYLKSYTKGELCIIELTSGISFEVSRRRKQEILQRLHKS